MSVVSCLGSGLLPPAVPIVAPSAVGYIRNRVLGGALPLGSGDEIDIFTTVLPVGVWQVSSSVVVRSTVGDITAYSAELLHPYFTAIALRPLDSASGVASTKISTGVSGVLVSDGVLACRLAIAGATADASDMTISGTESSMQFVKIA